MESIKVLITVTGKDAPGITASMTGILAEHQIEILHIGQSVIHDLLSLSLLIDIQKKDSKGVLKDLLFAASEKNLKLDFKLLKSDDLEARKQVDRVFRYVVTFLGESITALALNQVTSVLSKYGLNIDNIQKLSETNCSSLELIASSQKSVSERELREELLTLAGSLGIDLALQVDGPFRRMKRLIVFDMDSTLIQNEVIDEMARVHGVYDEVSKVTEEAMKGNMEFKDSLKKRVGLLKGMPVAKLEDVYKRIELTPGAQELVEILKRLGYKVALISGGFTWIAERIRDRLKLDYIYANQLEIKDNVLTGNVVGSIVDSQRKADLLETIAQQERISLEQVIAVGDGANDLLMLERAGLGIAFNAKPIVRKKADLSLTRKDLRPILHLLGLSTRDLKI